MASLANSASSGGPSDYFCAAPMGRGSTPHPPLLLLLLLYIYLLLLLLLFFIFYF
jgi:hypothetical protein